jgi:hypothetical protein
VSALSRGLLLIVLAVGVLGFGAVGLCGGVFTAMALPELLNGGAALMAMSLPCLAGGLFMVWICARKILRMLRTTPGEEEASS